MSPIRFVLLILLLLVGAACGGDREPKGLYNVEDRGLTVDEEEILASIDQLAAGKDQRDAAAAKTFDDAVQKLTLEGASVESYLIEALVGHNDWAVRYGVIHVLDSIGSKACIPALITALADEHPVVAQKAMYTLRVFCDHREVPEVGEPVGANGLPPVPERAEDGLRPQAQLLIWEAWHDQHGQALRGAWQNWWDENRHLVKIGS